jgi:hypothetical protein
MSSQVKIIVIFCRYYMYHFCSIKSSNLLSDGCGRRLPQGLYHEIIIGKSYSK